MYDQKMCEKIFQIDFERMFNSEAKNYQEICGYLQAARRFGVIDKETECKLRCKASRENGNTKFIDVMAYIREGAHFKTKFPIPDIEWFSEAEGYTFIVIRGVAECCTDDFESVKKRLLKSGKWVKAENPEAWIRERCIVERGDGWVRTSEQRFTVRE